MPFKILYLISNYRKVSVHFYMNYFNKETLLWGGLNPYFMSLFERKIYFIVSLNNGKFHKNCWQQFR